MVAAIAFFVLNTAVSAAISFAFPAEGPRLKDLSISTSTYGNAIPRVWGTVRVGANMIWANPIKEHKHKKKAGLGQFYNQYTYSADFAMAICKGPAQSMRRIWANGKLIYDATGASKDVNNSLYKFTFYKGDEDQLQDPLIVEGLGEANTPAYRGTCYVVFEEFDLTTDFGNQIPQIAVEVYVGNDTSTPVTYLTTDGTTRPTFSDDTYGADFERGYVYLPDEAAHTIQRFKMSDGTLDLTVAPTVAPEDFWDTGALTQIYGVLSDGSPLVTMGGDNNLMKVAKLDPFSLQVTQTTGHSIPGSSYSSNSGEPLPGPFYDYARIAYFDDTRTNVLAVSWGKSLTIFSNMVGSSSNMQGSALGSFGSNLTSLAACGFGEAAWIVFTTTGFFGTDNLMTVQTVGSGAVGPFTLTNPDAGAGSTFVTALAVAHDTATNAAILFYNCGKTNNYYATKFSFDTHTVVWNVKLPGGFPNNYVCSALATDVIGWKTDDKLWLLDTTDGTFVNRGPDALYYTNNEWLQISDLEYTNPGNSGYALPTGIGSDFQQYDGTTGSLVVLGGGLDKPAIIRVGQFGNDTVTLDYIIGSLLSETGLTPDQYDTSGLSGVAIRGYGFAQATDLKGIIGELQQIFLFDLIERDGQIVAVVRGGTTAAETISYKALGSQGGDNPDRADFWKETRFSEADLPRQVTLSYFNTDLDYQTSTAVSKRLVAPLPTMFSQQQDALEASIVFNATEAKNRVNAMLYVAWSERTKHQTKFPLAYAYLEPTDLISVVMADSRTYFERIERQEMGADFTTDTDTRGQDSGTYNFNLVGDGGSGFHQVISTPQPARPFIFNTPYLRDVDATGDGVYSIFYEGAGNLGAATFAGATMFISSDGQTYDINDAFQNDVEWGSVKSLLPPPSHGCYALDWVNTVTIYPATAEFELETITDDDLWSGQNLCMVGNEAIQFRDAVQNADGSWTISNLLRGRRGTEYACDTHAIGEAFVFLNVATIDVAQQPLDAGGKDIWFKAVGTGRAVDTALTLEVEYEPRDLMPYAPADIRRAFSGSDITITWNRRTRLGGNMMDGTGTVPLSETSEAYEIYLLSGPFIGDLSMPDLPTNIVRKLTATSETVTYTAAEQTADSFTHTTDTLHVVVYQISGAVGRGFPGVRDITATAFF